MNSVVDDVNILFTWKTEVPDLMLMLSLIKQYVFRRRPTDSAKVPEVNRDVPLDSKLKELDALYEPKLKNAKAKARAW